MTESVTGLPICQVGVTMAIRPLHDICTASSTVKEVQVDKKGANIFRLGIAQMQANNQIQNNKRASNKELRKLSHSLLETSCEDLSRHPSESANDLHSASLMVYLFIF